MMVHFLTRWFCQLLRLVSEFKRHSSTPGNAAEYSTFCLSESLSVSVRTKPPTFYFLSPSLPVQRHVHTSQLKKDIQSYLIFVNPSFAFKVREALDQGHWPLFDWLVLKYQAVLCCEGEYKWILSLHEGHTELQKRKAHQISSQHPNLSAAPAGPDCWAPNQWSRIQPSWVHTAGTILSLHASQWLRSCSFSSLK